LGEKAGRSSNSILKQKEVIMSSNVYKKLELTGSSNVSIEDAVQLAVSKAAETVHNLGWFEVTEIRGRINGAQIEAWQVTVKIGFTVDE
jgi:dodecin